jgi:hypothetical protein
MEDAELMREDDLLREWRISVLSQAALQTLLEEGERVLDARPRNWWYAHRAMFMLTGAGTVAFVGLMVAQLAMQQLFKYFYYFLMMLMFPVLLVGLMVQGLRARTRESWVAATDQRVLQYVDDAVTLSARWSNVLGWRSFANWLMWTTEVELRVRPEQVFHATTISRQSPFKVVYVDGLLPSDRQDMERLIAERVGGRAPPSEQGQGAGSTMQTI